MVTGNPALANTSTGSPVSRLLWQRVAEPGKSQLGVALLMNGSFAHSETSWLRATTSVNVPPKIWVPAQLAHANVCTAGLFSTGVASKAVWKPTMQHCLMLAL